MTLLAPVYGLSCDLLMMLAAHINDLCLNVQEATGVKVAVQYADQGDTGAQTALEAIRAGVELILMKR